MERGPFFLRLVVQKRYPSKLHNFSSFSYHIGGTCPVVKDCWWSRNGAFFGETDKKSPRRASPVLSSDDRTLSTVNIVGGASRTSSPFTREFDVKLWVTLRAQGSSKNIRERTSRFFRHDTARHCSRPEAHPHTYASSLAVLYCRVRRETGRRHVLRRGAGSDCERNRNIHAEGAETLNPHASSACNLDRTLSPPDEASPHVGIACGH